MIYRLINLILIIPCAFFSMLFYVLYPILGYILGRGFQHSLNEVNDITMVFMIEGAIEYIKEVLILIKGEGY